MESQEESNLKERVRPDSERVAADEPRQSETSGPGLRIDHVDDDLSQEEEGGHNDRCAEQKPDEGCVIL